MEHYQTNGTPEGSTSKHTVFTPVAPRSNVAGPNEEALPPELCENCCHGSKVCLCILARLSASEIASILMLTCFACYYSAWALPRSN